MADEEGLQVDPRIWGKHRGIRRNGKEYAYPLICHCLDTGAMAGELWDRILSHRTRRRIAEALGVSPEVARSLVCAWAALHDIGKATPPFQAKLPERYEEFVADPAFQGTPSEPGEDPGHGYLTQWILVLLLAEIGYPNPASGRNGQNRPRTLAGFPHHQVAQLLGGHHGCFHIPIPSRRTAAAETYQPALGNERWREIQREHCAAILRITGGLSTPEQPLSAELAVVVAGVVVIADWLASQEHVIHKLLPPEPWQADYEDLRAHWEAACALAPDVVSEAQLGRTEFPSAAFADQFPAITTPNPLQVDVAAELPRLVGGAALRSVDARSAHPVAPLAGSIGRADDPTLGDLMGEWRPSPYFRCRRRRNGLRTSAAICLIPADGFGPAQRTPRR